MWTCATWASYSEIHRKLWLRLGNCSARQVDELLQRDFDVIKLFYEDGTYRCSFYQVAAPNNSIDVKEAVISFV